MQNDWRSRLTRWTEAGVIDAGTADRIREYEARHAGATRFGWPILVALAFGALMLGGGILLFVAAHWDALAPMQRFGLVLLMVGGFHAAGALIAGRFAGMAIALHAIGTAALGAGIALAGQIFNLDEHWPGGIMLWAAGAVVAFALLRQIPQLVLAAVLLPAWLASECIVATGEGFTSIRIVASGVFLMALTYFTAAGREGAALWRRALVWLGGIALVPAGVVLAFAIADPYYATRRAPDTTLVTILWVLAIALPLVAAAVIRREAARWNAAAAIWVALLGLISYADSDLGLYAWWAAGAVGLVGWGVYEGRSERVNMGAAAFAATVTAFYFSSVMDKLERSASLVGLGLLFLVGGWALERVRRRLVAQARAHA